MSPSDLAVQEQRATSGKQRVVNDFSIQVATVNGSGSQTANMVLLRSILLMGVPVSGKNMFPVEHRRLAHLVHDPGEQARLHRPQEGSRLPRRDERRDREGRRAHARSGRRRRLRRAAEAEHAAQRPRVLPGAVRQARRPGLSRREAAPARPQHDLRRDPRQAARHRPEADGAGARQAARAARPRPSRSTRAPSRPASTTPRRTSRSRIRSSSRR